MNPLFSPLKLLLFDWGDTLMRDFKDKDGPMCYWDEVALIEGIEEFLNLCYEKYPLMVASNSGFSTTDMMIKALYRGGIDKHFSRFFTSKDIGVEKPNLLFFEYIIREVNLDPASIAFFGNDYKKDIEPSKLKGMTTFFFNENNLQGTFPAADFIFAHFTELHEIFL